MAVAVGVLAGHAAVKVDRIEPTNWYVGLKDPCVQLMVYGEGIRDAEVVIDYAGVAIDSLVRLDSPNYLLIYLNTGGAQPGTMDITFKQGRSKKKVKYQLLAREMSGDKRMGFTNADVLYMLMPDRFADGNPANNQIAGHEPEATGILARTSTRPYMNWKLFRVVTQVDVYSAYSRFFRQSLLSAS